MSATSPPAIDQMDQAARLWRDGDQEGAIAAYRRLVARLPADPAPSRALALVLRALGRLDDAVAARLKVRAALNGRSTEAEVRAILAAAVRRGTKQRPAKPPATRS